MNRRLVGVLALGLVIAAVLVLWWRRGDEPAKAAKAPPSARAGSAAMTAPAAKATDQAPPPQQNALRWTLDIDPEGPLRLEGQVIGPDGDGVAGAHVALASVPRRTTVTDEDGSFAFDKLVGRTYQLTAHHDDLVSGTVIYKLVEGGDPVVLRLAAGAAVDVRVTDESAKPVAGATVKLRDLSERSVTTDANGLASITPVTPGWVAVEASAPGFATAGGVTTVGAAGARGSISLSLVKGYAVSGKVTDERGAPLAKVRVIAKNEAPWGGWGAGEPPAETTNEKGVFTFAALPPSSLLFIAMDGEHAPAASKPVKIVGAPIYDVTIVMPAGGVVTGQVVSPDGAGVPYATVRIAGKPGKGAGLATARQATTDKSGAFEIRGLARTALHARAESDLAASALTDVDLTQAPTKETKLVLDVTGTIAGIVVDENGAPVPEVSVNAWPDVLAGAKPGNGALAGFSSATTDGEGRFVIRGLPDDQYRLWATRAVGADSGWGKNSVAARVGDQNTRLELPSPGGVKGTLVIEGGEAPNHATVQLGFGAPTPAHGGGFDIPDIAPGAYDITFQSLEFAERIERGVRIEPGKKTDLGTITLARGRILRGTVVDSAGRPVGGAKVRVGERLASSNAPDDGQLEQWDLLANVRSATTLADGSFTIIGVPRKLTSAAAEHATGRSLPVEISPGDGDPPMIRLALRGYGAIAGTVTKRGQPVPNVAVDEVTKGAPAQNSFAITRDDGTFLLERVPEGVHVVTANQRHSMTSRGGAVTVNVTAGRTTTTTIELPAGDVALEVTVTPQGGAKLDAAQMFLFGGTVSVDNGQALVNKTLDGGTVSMRFWFGPSKPQPVFEEMPPGAYSLCSIPITGDMNDPTFMQRIQENIPALRVYCAPVTIKPQPERQTFTQTLPAMTPLPPPS